MPANLVAYIYNYKRILDVFRYDASISWIEYSCQVSHYGLPEYLLKVTERIQSKALRIIYPQLSYQDALNTSWDCKLYIQGDVISVNKLFDSILSDEERKLRKLLAT